MPAVRHKDIAAIYGSAQPEAATAFAELVYPLPQTSYAVLGGKPVEQVSGLCHSCTGVCDLFTAAFVCMHAAACTPPSIQPCAIVAQTLSQGLTLTPGPACVHACRCMCTTSRPPR